MEKIRLSKYFTDCGIMSRRAAEEEIKEYKAIFIIGAVDGRFPSLYSFNSEEELEEELRLMYVAITRAKTHLAITYPIDMFDYATGMVLSKPSRFLDGIGQDILEKWIIEE